MDFTDMSPAIWLEAKKEYRRIKEEGFGDPRYYDEVFEFADKGIELPCLFLSLVCLDPELDDYNPRKAIQYIRSLIQGKNFEAILCLAEYLIIQNEDGVARKIGMKVLRAMAEAGHTSSQHLLSYFLFDGTCMEKNVEEALFWLTKAAQSNDSEAQLALAYRYLNGDEIPQDRKRAFYWARRADALGNTDAFWVLWQEEMDE